MKIIAHRANDGIHRENSLEAILNSLNKSYIDGVEFDIRLTKDNKFILNHDPFYLGHLISSASSKTLKKIGLNILEDVLSKLNTDKIILIEIKNDYKKYSKISKYLNKILKKYQLNIYLCSFDYNLINYINKKYKYKCGIIIGKIINQKHINNNLHFNSISYKYKGLIPKKETFYWTINNPKNIKKGNIITDKPKTIYESINQKNL